MAENITKIRDVEYFGIARKIVSHMTTKSWDEVPHTAMIYEPDVTDFMVAYKELQKRRAAEGKSKVTLNTIMLRIIVEGLKQVPAMNATLEFNKKNVSGKITHREDIDISIPWVLPSGEMMTLCVHDIENDSLDKITEKLNELGEKAKNTNMTEAMYEVSFDQTLKEVKSFHLGVIRRIIVAKFGKNKIPLLKGQAKKDYYSIPTNKRITLEDIKPGTITVSNLGSVMKGIDGAITLLDIIPPQVCVIGFCGTLKKPRCIEHEDGTTTIEPRLVIPMTIACDHRAADGGDVIPFFYILDNIFKNPEVIFDW